MSAWNDASNLIEHMENQTGDFITVQKKMQLSQTEIIAYLRSDDNPWNMAHRKGYSVSGVDFDLETTTSEASMGDEDEDAFATEEMENAEEDFVTTTTTPETTDGRDLETGSTQTVYTTVATKVIFATQSVTMEAESTQASDEEFTSGAFSEGTPPPSDVLAAISELVPDESVMSVVRGEGMDADVQAILDSIPMPVSPGVVAGEAEMAPSVLTQTETASFSNFNAILTVNSIGIEKEYEDALKVAERRSLPAQTLDLEEAGLTITKELPKIEVTTEVTTEGPTATNVETTRSSTTTVAPTTAAKSGSFVIQALAAAAVGTLWLVAQ